MSTEPCRRISTVAWTIRDAVPHLTTTVTPQDTPSCPSITVHEGARPHTAENLLLAVDIDLTSVQAALLGSAYGAARVPHWWLIERGGGITALTLEASGYKVVHHLAHGHLIYYLAQKTLAPATIDDA